jgi:hypothetical protein
MFWELRYELAFLAGNTADVERQVSVAMSHGEDGVLALQADTEAYYGHLAKAREFTRRASESARRNGDLESAIGYEVIGALREADFGNLQRARRQVATALAAGAEERSRVLSALVLARAGESAAALAVVRDLHRQFRSNTLVNGYWIPTVLAAIQSRNNPSKAIEILDVTMPYELGLPQTPANAIPYPIYTRGLAFLSAGNGRRAAEEFQKILDHPGIVGNYPLGALAHLGLARAYALQVSILAKANCDEPSEKCYGNREQARPEMLASAREAYKEFFSLWKDADPSIPILKQARTEFQKLAWQTPFHN